MALTAAREWPVLTGLSRAALSLAFSSVAPGVFSGTLRSGAPYTPFIRPAGERRARAEAKARGEKYIPKKDRLPGWKVQYLVEVSSGVWRFDSVAYSSRRRAERAANPDRKRATGRPYVDLIARPSRPTLNAIAKDVLEVANKGAL